MNIKKRFLILYFVILTSFFIGVWLFINAQKHNKNFIDFSKNYFENNIEYASKLSENLNIADFNSKINEIKNNLDTVKSKNNLKKLNSKLNDLILELLHKTYSIEEYKKYIIEIYDVNNNHDSLYTFYDDSWNFEKIKINLLNQLEKSTSYKEVDKAKAKFEEYILDKTYSQNIINIKWLLSDIKTVFSIIEEKLSSSEIKSFKTKTNYLNKLFSDISHIDVNKKIDYFEKSLLINEFYNKYEQTSNDLYFIENYNKTWATPEDVINNQLKEIKSELVTNAQIIDNPEEFLSQANQIEIEMVDIEDPNKLIELNSKIIDLTDSVYWWNSWELESMEIIELEEIAEERIDYLIKKLNKVLQLWENKIASQLLEKTKILKQKININNNNILSIENDLNIIEDRAYNSWIFDKLLYWEYVDEVDLILTEKSFIEDQIKELMVDIEDSGLPQDKKDELIKNINNLEKLLEKTNVKNKDNIDYIYKLSEQLSQINNNFYNILSTNNQSK